MRADWLWDRKIDISRVKSILNDPGDKEFFALAALLLARNNEPREVFSKYIKPLVFCKNWNGIKKIMRKDKWAAQRIIFWQAVYEKIADKYRSRGIVFREGTYAVKNIICKETGARIGNIRREQGLSQKEFAKKIGISQQVISRVEKGKENVSLIMLNNISRALNKRLEIAFR